MASISKAPTSIRGSVLFGRKQVSAEAGYQSGNWAAYGAFEAINDDGFRDFSDAEFRRGYFDLGVKGDINAEFHFSQEPTTMSASRPPHP